MNLDLIAQIGISALGAGAVALMGSPNPRRRRWAPVLGLAGQPFWFYTVVAHDQWGMLGVVLLYTAVWWSGLRIEWGRRPAVIEPRQIEVRR